jgi:hypothetical protein
MRNTRLLTVVAKEQICFALRHREWFAEFLLDCAQFVCLDLGRWVHISRKQLPQIEPHGGSPGLPCWCKEMSMANTTYPPPRHWEDWVNLVLGLWLFVSPWVLRYRETTAAPNAFVVGFLLMATAVIALAAFLVWEEWFSVVLGVWLVVSPWILGAAFVPMVYLVIVGFLVLALALHAIWDERRHLAHPA